MTSALASTTAVDGMVKLGKEGGRKQEEREEEPRGKCEEQSDEGGEEDEDGSEIEEKHEGEGEDEEEEEEGEGQEDDKASLFNQQGAGETDSALKEGVAQGGSRGEDSSADASSHGCGKRKRVRRSMIGLKGSTQTTAGCLVLGCREEQEGKKLDREFAGEEEEEDEEKEDKEEKDDECNRNTERKNVFSSSGELKASSSSGDDNDDSGGVSEDSNDGSKDCDDGSKHSDDGSKDSDDGSKDSDDGSEDDSDGSEHSKGDGTNGEGFSPGVVDRLFGGLGHTSGRSNRGADVRGGVQSGAGIWPLSGAGRMTGFTVEVKPPSAVLDRLRSFLPQMAAANESLQKAIQTQGHEAFTIDCERIVPPQTACLAASEQNERREADVAFMTSDHAPVSSLPSSSLSPSLASTAAASASLLAGASSSSDLLFSRESPPPPPDLSASILPHGELQKKVSVDGGQPVIEMELGLGVMELRSVAAVEAAERAVGVRTSAAALDRSGNLEQEAVDDGNGVGTSGEGDDFFACVRRQCQRVTGVSVDGATKPTSSRRLRDKPPLIEELSQRSPSA